MGLLYRVIILIRSAIKTRPTVTFMKKLLRCDSARAPCAPHMDDETIHLDTNCILLSTKAQSSDIISGLPQQI